MKHIRKYLVGLIFFGGLSLIAIASVEPVESTTFPTPLDAYSDNDLIKRGEIMAVLINRVGHTPFNLWASLIFLFAILHTFFAAKILVIAKKVEQKNEATPLHWQGQLRRGDCCLAQEDTRMLELGHEAVPLIDYDLILEHENAGIALEGASDIMGFETVTGGTLALEEDGVSNIQFEEFYD